MEQEEESSRRKQTPTGLLILFALLAMVGYQTLAMGELPSFDLRSSAASSEIFATTAVNTTTLPVASSSSLKIRTRRTNRKITRVTIPLEELTFTPNEAEKSENCKDPMRWIFNKGLNDTVTETDRSKADQKIPRIVHQTSKTKCVHRAMTRSIRGWREELPEYQYYMHDDDAIWRLVHQEWPEFPHLAPVVKCLKSMTALTDVWRLLVLWEYGGVYADLDAQPALWNQMSIQPNDDAYFVVEHYDAPSQYFMASTPRHPILYYAIHHALHKILASANTQKINAAYVTGPFALLDGFSWFYLDGKPGVFKTKPIGAGTYQGPHGRSIRIEGFGRTRSDEIIKREAVARQRKEKLYQTMNMTHFYKDLKEGMGARTLGRSCFAITYDLLIGPPEWYKPTAEEDRKTIGGVF